MGRAKWIWLFGDFECLHLKKVNYRRTERGYSFPPFWQQPEVSSNVRFYKEVSFAATETFTVTAKGSGFVEVGENRYALGAAITLLPGDYRIEVAVCNDEGLPCIFVQGNTLISDESWECGAYDGKGKVGYNELYMDKESDPNVFRFEYERILPTSVKRMMDGVLYDFGKETFAVLRIVEASEPFWVYFGETEEEALDRENCYVFCQFFPNRSISEEKSFGFRYCFIPNFSDGTQPEVQVFYEYLPQSKPIARFESSDEELNEIWKIAGRTLELNSREFYLDGIKRDRWVWSGDSYQCYFTNRYYAFDTQLAKRNILALAGKGKISRHINTINDYTLYWILSVYDYYWMTGEADFLQRVFGRMQEFMDFCLARLDENGLMIEKEGDWIFIDWADMDKVGPFCAEQMLLLKSLESFCECADVLGVDCTSYRKRSVELKKTICEKYWDEEKGAFVDSFVSEKRNVTRHANLFAILFGIASKEQTVSICRRVILNDEIPPISTPYFKFYELEAIGKLIGTEELISAVKAYWGEMVEAGATSFWEEFQKGVPWRQQLSMYGQKYGKSLCHAWGASPIYLIGRYVLGVYPTSVGYQTFCVEPQLDMINTVRAVLPLNGGTLHLEKTDGRLCVSSSVGGGLLKINGNEIPLEKNKPCVIDL